MKRTPRQLVSDINRNLASFSGSSPEISQVVYGEIYHPAELTSDKVREAYLAVREKANQWLSANPGYVLSLFQPRAELAGAGPEAIRLSATLKAVRDLRYQS